MMSVLPARLQSVTTPEPYKILEASLSSWSYCANIVACSSGTAALHLALEALKMPLGASVVVPNYTMVACPRAIELAGFTPVFCEVNDSMLMDLEHLDSILSTDDTVIAVMPVHLYGRKFPMKELEELRGKYGVFVIEDLAEGHGISPYWSADASCWSFYRNKIVAGEEGGAIAFSDSVIAERARSLRSLGFTDAHDYTHVPRGHNYRMSNAHASLVLDSLSNVESNLVKRKEIEAIYNKLIPYDWHNVRAGEREVVWVYDIRIPGLDRDKQDLIVRTLRQNGIEARHGFKPMTSLEEWKGLGRKQRKKENKISSRQDSVGRDNRTWLKGGKSNSEILSREIIYLPVEPDRTTPQQIFKASELIHSIMAGK